MANEFDPIKAEREMLTGLNDVYKVIHSRARDAEQRMAEAESDYNQLLKLERFTEDLVKQAQERLQKLEQEHEQKSKT